jgi:CBS domain-containing protein
MKPKRVIEIMTREVEFVEPATTVRDAAAKMKALDLGSLPVCEGGRLTGVVTDREMTLRLAAEGRDPRGTRVREIMDPNPAFLKEEDDVSSVPRAMEEKFTHRVFVVDKEGRLAGIVSLGKVARLGNERLAGKVVRKISRPRRKTA